MKVFLIGCGDIARHHGRAVVRLGGSITGCFDISQANAQLCADEFGCPIVGYDEIESYMPQSDYAVISTPRRSGSTTSRWCSSTTCLSTSRSPWPAPWRTR